MTLGERIYERRAARNLSQTDLADALGVSRQTISKWKLAQSYPDFQRLVLLSDYYGLPLDALVKDVDVQDVRDRNQNDRLLSAIYEEVSSAGTTLRQVVNIDRKSTRLNSSHSDRSRMPSSA